MRPPIWLAELIDSVRRCIAHRRTSTRRSAAGIQAIIDRDFPPESHPYRLLERAILRHVASEHTVLDLGCGRGAPTLVRLKGHAKTLIGVDLVDFEIADPELRLLNGDVCDMSFIPSGSIDLAYSRSVMEHLKDTTAAFAEINRVLKPHGKYIFWTPNAWDYVSVIAKVIPNRFHSKIVHVTTGRGGADIFPTFYNANTSRRINRIAKTMNFELLHFAYLGQYPAALAFNVPLFRMACSYEKFLRHHHSLQFLRGWILCVMCKRSRQDLSQSPRRL